MRGARAFLDFCTKFRKIFSPASGMEEALKPPSLVANMKVLDKELFNKEIELPYIGVADNKVSDILPKMKKYLLRVDHYKPISRLDDNIVLFLNPLKVGRWEDLEETDRNYLVGKNIDAHLFKFHKEVLKYNNYSAEDVLRAVLPKDKEGMASFTKIGHIVHVNLREHLLPYKNVIGEVLFDKVSGCRTVVNKVNMIDNTYRNFQMEILCGEEDFVAKLKENKCTFEFDFSKVYWNSRLCTEHERIVDLVGTEDVLFDVFAGVGPFSVPVAKKKCPVFANDLNPESYKWLKHNAKINKIGDNLSMSNKDGKDFILNEVKDKLLGFVKERKRVFVVMNLPALAVEFLGAFNGLYSDVQRVEMDTPPTIYVYCFAKGEEPEEIARRLVVENFGWDVSAKILEVFRVRTVSSMKEMMRVAIRLDEDIKTNISFCSSRSRLRKRCSRSTVC
ncbi:PREDICTED: tRNA (guanine(37)-N1)-methyltransferase isoform X2 [Nicrophorus vespilloides]|uniref:tRNA (guanine(37)-N1)-methyltransferase n=1 Tax=Nicrophorus vespilloides TaxID=110193 RepID=A0ABM1MVN7_NICVS|nr:PREDICTED: tRNA (guanine(37)-N1)-methyltransferase isoform X2 [Nicrophorus vespilloides]